jgi:hypothetical protein
MPKSNRLAVGETKLCTSRKNKEQHEFPLARESGNDDKKNTSLPNPPLEGEG